MRKDIHLQQLIELNKNLEEEVKILRNTIKQFRMHRSISTSGKELGVLKREASREIRFSWDSVRGHSYLRIQVFQYDLADDGWRPLIGKCFSVRLHELAEVKRIIQAAINLAIRESENNKSELDISNSDFSEFADNVIRPLVHNVSENKS